MSGTSLQFAFLNTTTIENLSRRSKVWQMAVYMARPPSSGNRIGFPSVTYPLTDDTSIPQPSSSKRTFAILHSKPGENPWDLGPFANFKSVMGVHWYDWLIPLRYSPCRDHSRGDSEFELGPVVDRMRIDAGLLSLRDPHSKSVSRWKHYRSRNGKQRNVEEADGSKTRDGSTRFPRERGRDDAMNYEGRNASIELRDSNRIHDE
jgi:palmitoyltransferase